MTAPPSPEDFVHWFRQAAPYLHAFGERTFVIGFGGELITERARFAQFIQDVNLLAALEIRLVLVHGARPQIEAELKAKGLRSRYAKGLRVTDAAALTAVKHAAGMLRVELEALLSQGLPNSPMAGAEIRVASGNYIAARPIGVLDGVDYQFTGQVRKVDAVAITRHLEGGDVVLVPNIGYSPTGEVFNVAWEDVAQSVSTALRADKLLLFVDRLPTDRKGQVLGELTAREAEALAKKDGLGPHTSRALRAALGALGAGVGRVHLISRRTSGATLLELFTHTGVGTMITADPVQRLREARIEDVGGILGLIEPLEADGTLVKRGRERLEREIGNFLVLEHDGVIVGCAALYPLPDRGAEIACLAVAPGARDTGHGERLLQACEARAKQLRIRRLFALTTRAEHWFVARGFRPAAPAALPAERQALYNWRRGSKVFLKRI
ncbi:MAG: amino-acid N-acetyltransferase [Betaproteobacteria bacterium]|nr:amino-acid N-acetyltransferase [Betaproteobacteria bacterium]MDH5219684.1 amino-acid N-acetyltransferase [Betaproteobacteria bacterium]